MAPDSAEVLMAWANLLSAMVQTMRDEGVGVDVIHGFLERLDLANFHTLQGDMLSFVLFVTDEMRRGVPSND